MHDNPPSAEAGTFALPSHSIVTLSGRDAITFAQSQFFNDLNLIEPGQWQWSGWLTPKGRVIALFALIRLDAETVWLLLPDADAATLAQQLSRFVFRSKVAIAAPAGLRVVGAFAPPAQASGNALARPDAATLELDFGADDGSRRLLIGEIAASSNAEALAAWKAFDLRHGLPRLSATQAEQWTPQQLSLERLKAFSVKKGCYPGQEIVARTHFLGKAKRGLVLIDSPQPLDEGAAVQGDEGVAGSVISTADSAGQHCSLAVLPLERGASPLHAAGQPLEESLLREGLAR